MWQYRRIKICANYLPIFFSLDPLVTKNHLLRAKCRSKFFLLLLSHFEKRRGLAVLLFPNGKLSKNFAWHLVFSSWFLVSSGSNEKGNTYWCSKIHLHNQIHQQIFLHSKVQYCHSWKTHPCFYWTICWYFFE